jgi:hypothetical protein
MKQTAMQELRNDLVKAKEKSITALNDINNEILRKTCQEAVKLTIESIIERIDDELLEMEEQQIVDAFIGYDSDTEDNLEVAEQYYNETFKKQQQ